VIGLLEDYSLLIDGVISSEGLIKFFYGSTSFVIRNDCLKRIALREKRLKVGDLRGSELC
jgi:hypothetical protein